MKPEDYRDEPGRGSLFRPRNYVRPPVIHCDLTAEQFEAARALMEGLHAIEPVHLVVVFDAEPPADRVELVNPTSPPLFELLSRANLQRGTVVVFEVRGEAVAARILARLNWFLHVHGYTRGFRAWRIAQEAEGAAVAKSRFAWANLKQAIGL